MNLSKKVLGALAVLVIGLSIFVAGATFGTQNSQTVCANQAYQSGANKASDSPGCVAHEVAELNLLKKEKSAKISARRVSNSKSEKIPVAVVKNADDAVLVDQKFVVVVDTQMQGEQLRFSEKMDSVFASADIRSKNTLYSFERAIEMKKRFPEQVVVLTEFGNILALDKLDAQVTLHSPSLDSLGVKFVVVADTLGGLDSLFADTGIVQMNEVVNDNNPAVQLKGSNETMSQQTVVKDDVSKTEDVPAMKQQKVKKKKLPNDNEIVKHNHKKLKKEKKESKKKKSKESIEINF